MRITLDWPSNKLSPNARLHWSKLVKPKRQAKDEAFWATKEAMAKAGILPGRMAGPVDVLMVFYPPPPAKYDLDGLQSRMKVGLDGIALALGIDDCHFRPVSQLGTHRRPGAVVVTLTPAVVEIPVRGEIS